MAGEQVDLKLFDLGDFYDIAVSDSGDLDTTEGVDTSLIVSIFTDRRASESEVSPPQNRRGWFGNLFKAANEPEIGSKLWLLDQQKMTPETPNDAVSYIQDAFGWLVLLNYADKVEVTGSSNFDTINIFVRIIKNNQVVNQLVYNLWANTINEIVNNG